MIRIGVVSRNDAPQRRSDHAAELDNTLVPRSSRRTLQLVLCTHAEGVMWRGLYPLLLESSSRKVTVRAIKILICYFTRGLRQVLPSGEQPRLLLCSNQDDDKPPSIGSVRCLRTSKTTGKLPLDVEIALLPPQVTRLQTYFSGILISYEHMHISLQSLSAWLATLGGGYFLCRHLSTAVYFARQQRRLALFLGDTETADRCTLNEAFNYIHAGMFPIATTKIKSVQKSARHRGDTTTLRMVLAATLFLKRVKKAAMIQDRGRDETVDDYLRIRIVRDRSQGVTSKNTT